jgi:hypothetical protein
VRKIESISSKNTITGVPSELVEQLRTLDVEEERLRLVRVVPARRRDLLGQRVRHRLRDERLPAAGRPVEQHTLGRAQLVLAEELRVQERQLHGVADLLDLAEQPADVLVGDVGHLLQHEVFDLGLRDTLVGVAGLGVDQQGVAGLERDERRVVGRQGERRGEPHHALLVRVPHHERTAGEAVRGRLGQHLAQAADLADALEVAGLDDREGLVETHGLPAAQHVGLDRRGDRDAHAAPGGEHVDGLVGEPGQEDAVPAGRLRQPVDLLAERDELGPRLLEGLGQLLVAAAQLRDTAGGLGEPLLEDADVPRGLGDLAS